MRLPNGGKHSLPSVCELGHLVVGHLLEIIVEGCSRPCEAAGRLTTVAGNHNGIFAAGHVRLSRLPVYVSNPPLAQLRRCVRNNGAVTAPEKVGSRRMRLTSRPSHRCQ